MIAHHQVLTVITKGKGTYEITGQVEEVVSQSKAQTGTVTIFVRHTSASLVLYENADPTAREDLHNWMEQLADEDDPSLVHTQEGADDSTSHLRMVLTGCSQTIPVARGAMTLGTWQGIFLFEHRRSPHRRMIDVTVMGV